MNNQDVLENYIDMKKKGASKSNFRSTINIFFKFHKKSLSEIQKVDIMNFYDLLNNDEHYVKDTKKMIFSNVKQFLLRVLVQLESEILSDKSLKLEERLSNQMRITSILNYIYNGKNFSFKQGNHNINSDSNRDVILTNDEVVDIVQYFKMIDNNSLRNNKYLMIRLLAETGMRRGELISIDLKTRVNSHTENLEDTLRKRYVRTTGKTSELRGDKTYYISEELAQDLLTYLKFRKEIEFNKAKKPNEKFEPFFLSSWRIRCSTNYLSMHLRGAIKFNNVVDEEGVFKRVGTHTFRKTINTLRAKKGCPAGLMERLLNHKLTVNQKYYNKMADEELVKEFDIYNPFNFLF